MVFASSGERGRGPVKMCVLDAIRGKKYSGAARKTFETYRGPLARWLSLFGCWYVHSRDNSNFMRLN